MFPAAFRYLLWVLLLTAQAVPPAGADEAPRSIYVSIEPLRYLVDRVAGDTVEVRVVVQAGQRPETYEPTPRQIASLAAAEAFFGVGMPLERAWRRQIQSTGGSAVWVDLSEGLGEQPAPGDGEAEGAGHDHHGVDPHVWLSPPNARRMAATLFETLARLHPEKRDTYRENLARFEADLEALHRDVTAILAAAGVEAFLVFHPAWGHFAHTYGLTQMAIEAGGKEPGTRGLVEVIRAAREAGIGTVFVDPRHSPRTAATVAEALDGRIEVLDPLAYDYLDNLRSAAQAIAASGS